MDSNYAYAPLSESCAKLLTDKTYDKRKAAAVEIEKMASEFNRTNNDTQIRKLIAVLDREFTRVQDVNKRKGGLIALASVAIGLGKDSDKYVNELVVPILDCMRDPEQRVQFFANESLYNVVKVARGAVMPLFPGIFFELCCLVNSSDTTLKNGTEFLDRLLKDIVAENSQTFDLDAFIPLLRERIYLKSSFQRQFVISWLSTLNAVPQINLVVHLPELLDGLFGMLDDAMKEIHQMCESLLAQFLKSIRGDPSAVDMPAMTNILIAQAQSPLDLIKFTAITWIKEFVQLFGGTMLTFASGIFTAILPCLAYDTDSMKKIKDCAQTVNMNMMELVSAKERHLRGTCDLAQLNLDATLKVLRLYLGHNSVKTKVAVLKWIHHLFTEAREDMSPHAAGLFTVLLSVLSDDSDEVVLQGLVVLAEIVNSTQATEASSTHYHKFVKSLISLFKEDNVFLESRGSFIIRQLCVLLNAETIYRTFAEILQSEVSSTNIRFASILVRVLHTILVTSAELFELRSQLKNIRNEQSASLFQCLYRCWAHCPVSTVSLCLLAQCYEHVSALVVIFADLEITVEFLVEVDKLVQLIESPIFASLRLTLVSPRNNRTDAKHLSQALFGILMLLPQTNAFVLLKNRLQCVPNYWDIATDSSSQQPSIESQSHIEFGQLLAHFQAVQHSHQQLRISQRRRRVTMYDQPAKE